MPETGKRDDPFQQFNLVGRFDPTSDPVLGGRPGTHDVGDDVRWTPEVSWPP